MARKVIIKQRAAEWSQGLGLDTAYTSNKDKTDRKPLDPHSTVKGAFNRFTLRRGPDMRWLTGIDPDSGAFRTIEDEKLRKQKISEAEANKKRLERITGKDLSGTSDFWLNFSIKLVHQSGDTVLDLSEPDQEMQYYAGLASGLFAPSEDDLHQDKYRDCRFYVYNGEEVVSRQKQNKLKRREIISILYNYKSNKERLYYIAKVTDIVASRSMDAEDIFNIISDYAETLPSSKLESFKEVITRDPKELQVNVKTKEAIERDVIRYNSSTRSYLFLGKQVGKTVDNCIDFFSRSENEHLFTQLEESLEESL